MRDETSPLRVGRWDWYGRGDESTRRRPVRGSDVQDEDNSSEQVLWECGLVLMVPLAVAAFVELAIRFSAQ
jgi:hypothetical protein